jgi:hypothetical protein
MPDDESSGLSMFEAYFKRALFFLSPLIHLWDKSLILFQTHRLF